MTNNVDRTAAIIAALAQSIIGAPFFCYVGSCAVRDSIVAHVATVCATYFTATTNTNITIIPTAFGTSVFVVKSACISAHRNCRRIPPTPTTAQSNVNLTIAVRIKAARSFRGQSALNGATSVNDETTINAVLISSN